VEMPGNTGPWVFDAMGKTRLQFDAAEPGSLLVGANAEHINAIARQLAKP